MASSVDGTHYSYYLSCAAGGIVFTTGLMTQSFIVVAKILEKLKGATISTTDGIVTCLGILRAVYLLVCFSIIICQNEFEKDPVTRNILLFLHMNLSSAQIWLSTFLAIVFCLKISSFHCDSFLHLKMVISRRYVHVIIVLAFISVGYSSIGFWIHYNKIPYNSTTRIEHIKPKERSLIYLNVAYGGLILFWNCVLILLYCFSSITLITSLCLHVRKMKKVAKCLASHYQALKFTVFSLVGCTVHINITLFKGYLIITLGFIWAFIIMNIFPTLHSVYLICISSKLRLYFLRLLKHAFMKMFNRREEQHTTMVETITS